MSTQLESITILLANRSYLYRLLQRIFGDEPNGELMRVVTNEHTREAISLLQEGDKRLDAYLELLRELQSKLQDEQEETLDKLKSEYTYLMIGPGELPAPPWESVFLSNELRLFQERTLEVRKTYLQYHFLPSSYPREADDHLALELDFMTHLSQKTEEYFGKGKWEQVKEILIDQKTFLDEHLGLWIGKFANQIQESKTRYLYPQMALLTEQLLKIDRELIDDILYTL